MTTHQTPITFNGITAVGYNIIDPDTGAGAYKIGGGENGNHTTTGKQNDSYCSMAVLAGPVPISAPPFIGGIFPCEGIKVNLTQVIIITVLVAIAVAAFKAGAVVAIEIMASLVGGLSSAGVTAEELGHGCGNCTPDDHEALQSEVDKWCSLPFRCTSLMSPSELALRASTALACSDARKLINDTCYDGGDAGHQEAQKNAFSAYLTCLIILSGN